jgi:hypothetical protein
MLSSIRFARIDFPRGEHAIGHEEQRLRWKRVWWIRLSCGLAMCAAAQPGAFAASTAYPPPNNGWNYLMQGEYKSDVDDANWSAFSPVSGTGGAVNVLDTAPAAPARIYRVRRK